jgi:iron complex outermembrane receptor protein
LIDGRSVFLPTFSDVDWSHLGIAIEDVERIEVVRGSNAPAYGSNAFTATVNIITHQPFQDEGFFVQGTRGSSRTHNAVTRLAGSNGLFEYRVTAQYGENSGFSDINDSAHDRAASTRVLYHANGSDTFELQAGTMTGTQGLRTYVTRRDPPRDVEVDAWFGTMQWRHVLTADNEVQLQLYRNDYRVTDSFHFGPLSEVFGVPPEAIPLLTGGQPDQTLRIFGFDGYGRRTDLELQHRISLAARWRLAWGGSWRLDRLDSPWLGARNPKTNRSYRVFGQTEFQVFDDVTANLGAMTEHDSIVGTRTAPRAALNIHLTPRQTLRFSGLKAYRTPSLLENYSDGGINFNDGTRFITLLHSDESLVAEQMVAYDIGYIAEFPRTSFDVKWFRETISDLITSPVDYAYPTPIPDEYTSVTINDADLTTHGIEGALRYRPAPPLLLALQYSYARREGEARIRRNPDRHRDLSDTVPIHTVSFMMSQTLDSGLQISTCIYHLDEMSWIDGTTSLDGYDRVDLRVGQQVTALGTKLDLAMIAQNLVGEYSEFRKSNVFGQRIYFQVGAQF